MRSRILFVEDVDLFRETYVEVLERDGYETVGAATIEQARALLQSSGDWQLVVTDERLRGAEGPALGAELARDVATWLPQAKVIIITAYPTDATVSAGFEAGVYDYLVKGDGFEPMLRIKVRNAMEAVRSARLGRLAASELENELRTFWTAAKTEKSRNRKGLALEETFVRLFRSMQGLSEVQVRRTNACEEIDLVVANASPDPFWMKQGSYLFVECKNWSKPVGHPEVTRLVDRLRRHRACGHVGLLVAMNGFTGPAMEEVRNVQRENLWVIPLDASAVDALVQSGARAELLRRFFDKSVLP